jgi:hypothetical protein
VRSRRRTSSAQFFAVALSHADGFSGTPRNLDTSTARQKASCTTSSASARVANAEDARQRGDHASRLAPEEMIAELHLHVQNLHGPYFHGTADLQDGAALRKFHRVRKILRFDHDKVKPAWLCGEVPKPRAALRTGKLWSLLWRCGARTISLRP